LVKKIILGYSSLTVGFRDWYSRSMSSCKARRIAWPPSSVVSFSSLLFP